MKSIHVFPIIKVEISSYGADLPEVFNLYVNDEYEGTYSSRTDVAFRISLLTTNDLNRWCKHEDSIK